MKKITINSKQKLAIAGLAIVFISVFCQSVNAQSSDKKVSEIGWKSRLSSMGLNKPKNIGKTYNFYCQPASENFMHGKIWGTNTYTANSAICSTAVHAGMISASGGVVSIELQEGQEFYTGSTKNQIASEDHARTDVSFTFVGEVADVNSPKTYRDQQRRPATIEQVMVNSVQRGLERTIEEAISDLFK